MPNFGGNFNPYQFFGQQNTAQFGTLNDPFASIFPDPANTQGQDLLGIPNKVGNFNQYQFSDPNTTSKDKNDTGMVAGNLIGGAIGAYEFFHAQEELKNLDKQPVPNYSVSGELQNSYRRAEGMANEGFTPQEKAAYQNQLNLSNSNAYSRATQEAGGSLSNVISAGINSADVQGANKLSIADAELRRQNMQYADSLGSEIQTQKNLADKQRIDNYNRQQEAWGAASTAGLQSFMNSFTVGGLLKTGNGFATAGV